MQATLAVSITTLMAFASGLALWSEPPPPATVTRTAGDVAATVQAFLDGLPAELRAKAQRELGDDERTKWSFVPGRYAGVELGALAAEQRESLHAVLDSFLSAAGQQKVAGIMGLEQVLHEIEAKAGRDASHRTPDRYAVLVLGKPAPMGTFAVRLQGHHISLQFVVHEGRVAGHTPQFLGTNPHEVRTGKRPGLRVLGAEEDLARALLLLLDAEQLQQAVIADEAPADVLLGPGKGAAVLGPKRGLPWSTMTEVQQGVLWRLIEEYAGIWHGDLAAAELQRIRDGGRQHLVFAWAGGLNRGEGHYYRIVGEEFAIEYDNTQNGANHVHTVWRDFERDHGGDSLRRHLEQQHGRR